MKQIYLDNNSTTKVNEYVIRAMIPTFDNLYGNANATHSFGSDANSLLLNSKANIMRSLNVRSGDILFTSGATESINIAIKSIFVKIDEKVGHSISSSTEHIAMLNALNQIKKIGGGVSILEVDKDGIINLDDLIHKIEDDTRLISIMYSNNETGIIQTKIKEIGEIAREKDILFMCDCTQAIGKINLDTEGLGIDLMPFSGHKIHGPKGVGALYLSPKAIKALSKLSVYKDLRKGTPNTTGIVGLDRALELSTQSISDYYSITNRFRNQIEEELQNLGGVRVNGKDVDRLSNVSNLTIEGVNNRALLKFAKEIAFSTGSACNSANDSPSHVLKSMSLTNAEAKNTIRLSTSMFNTENEIKLAIQILKKSICEIRNLNN